MNRDAEELVRVATGTMVEMELMKQDLLDAGIETRVMGEELGIGLGSLLPDSVQLFVFQRDEPRARGIIENGPEHERPKFPHPESDPTPKQSGGRGPHTHYNPDPSS